MARRTASTGRRTPARTTHPAAAPSAAGGLGPGSEGPGSEGPASDGPASDGPGSDGPGGNDRGDPGPRIVDETLALAEEAGWEGVRLRIVAERLDMPLDDLARRYRDLDAIADAWLGRGVAAMLAPMPADVAALPPEQRVEAAILRFLDALAPHRAVTAAMIAAKLWPGHPHHWVPLVFNLSRTVHWIREAAGLDAGGVRRQMEEVALTALVVATFAVWCRDRSEGQARTRRFLHRSLAGGGRLYGRLLRARRRLRAGPAAASADPDPYRPRPHDPSPAPDGDEPRTP